MFGGNPSIAVLGPEESADEREPSESARAVGRALAAAGYTTIVAGTGETAGAASAGAEALGGQLLAVTPPDADPPGAQHAEGHLERIERPSVWQRIEAVLDHADALVILPGDMAALAALTQVWAWGHTPDEPYRPLLLFGTTWYELVEALGMAANLDMRSRSMVAFVEDADQLVETLRYVVAPRDG